MKPGIMLPSVCELRRLRAPARDRGLSKGESRCDGARRGAPRGRRTVRACPAPRPPGAWRCSRAMTAPKAACRPARLSPRLMLARTGARSA